MARFIAFVLCLVVLALAGGWMRLGFGLMALAVLAWAVYVLAMLWQLWARPTRPKRTAAR